MRQQTLQLGHTWARLTPWRGGGGAGQLVVGTESPVTAAGLLECCEQARRSGYRALFTSAVSPSESTPFVAAGFAVHENLHLLRADLHDAPPRPQLTLRRAGRRDRPSVLDLDACSFDDFWRLGPIGLHDALAATPVARFRVGDGTDGPVAYAITGYAGPHGYLQRVAVHPHARHQGWGRALVADALRWLWNHRVRRVYVNTQVHNAAAVALYESSGFVMEPAGLCVLGREL